MSRVAVVVLTWNAASTIAACLASLRGQLQPGDAVVVADNASTDGTVATARAAAPWAEVVEHEANLGFAAGNNRAIERALARDFEFVFVLNPDTVVAPGALAALRAAAAAAPGAWMLQPVLVRATGAGQVVDSLGLRPRRSFGGEDVGHGEPLGSIGRDTAPIFGACGAAAFCRADALRRHGAFDGDLFLLLEDLELALRWRCAGGEVLLVPAAIVEHRRGISAAQPDRAAARRRKHWLQRNAVALALRYWPWSLLLRHAPSLGWRIAQALWLRGSNPAQPCRPLWRRCWRQRGATRRAMRAHGVDRWFA